MKLERLQARAAEAERLLEAMASRPRLLILCELLDGERTVTELQQAVGIAMSAVSQHLAKLREANIVEFRRVSQTIRYSLSSEAARALLGSLYDIFCAVRGASKSTKRHDVGSCGSGLRRLCGSDEPCARATRLAVVVAADRLCRAQYAPGEFHRLLPGGDDLQGARREVRRRV
jgi:DNA-binding transcriptional ArsR family regulator